MVGSRIFFPVWDLGFTFSVLGFQGFGFQVDIGGDAAGIP